MKLLEIVKKYYENNPRLHKILLDHSRLVTAKALQIARKHKGVDIKFIKEASMLHDIGVYLTRAPDLFCSGREPYIKHGILGGMILRKEGLPKHARVCERHIGAGLTKADIIRQNLPLPKRSTLPVTREEKIICLADKFFSKTGRYVKTERKAAEIRKMFKKFGRETADRINGLIDDLL